MRNDMRKKIMGNIYTDGILLENKIYLYKWDEWNEPIVEERLKKSYYILKDKFSEH